MFGMILLSPATRRDEMIPSQRSRLARESGQLAPPDPSVPSPLNVVCSQSTHFGVVTVRELNGWKSGTRL